jgi:hypothetical protein
VLRWFRLACPIRARYVPAALAGFAVGVTGKRGYLLLGKVAEGACDLVLTGIAAVQVDQRSPVVECPMRSISSRKVAPVAAVSMLPVWRRS